MTTIFDTLLGAVPHMAPSTVSLEAWQGATAPSILSLTSRPPVQDSEEIRRVVALPRRPQVDLGPLSPKAQALVEIMNERLRRPDWARKDCKCAAAFNRDCILSLQPAQAWALYEAPLAGGLIALLATGSGKTAIGFLLPLVMSSKLAVGFVPSNLVEQLVREYELWREHWRVPTLVYGKQKGFYYQDGEKRPTLHIKTYDQLSAPSATTLLSSLAPDLVYADEMDKLSAMTSARTARFDRAFAAIPTTRFCGWTGTPWDKSILECTHLAAYALKDGSPLPYNHPHEARAWALALDPSDRPAAAGALRKFCAAGETLHQGFHRRLVETHGVVATREGAIGIPLNLYEREAPPIPPDVQSMIDKVRGFARPDGEELVDAMEVARVVCEVVCGFYYRWVFPKAERNPDGTLTKEATAIIERWRACRKAWRQELRLVTKAHKEYLDSAKLCEEAAIRFYSDYEGDLPTWESETYLAWKEVENTVYYETDTVWVNDYLAQDAANWAAEHRGIVWYRHTAFGKRVAELSGLPRHGGGAGAEQRILAERGDRSLIVSIQSHGRGRDGLQYLFNEQLTPVPPSSGKMFEQYLARLHRVGQKKPSVGSWYYRHVAELCEAFDKACSRARFAQTTWGAEQKILSSNCPWREEEDVDLDLDFS